MENQLIFNEHYPHPSADATILVVEKGDGINWVLKYSNIDISNSFAFGDGVNDICMFKHVGHGIAMGNAIDELKNIAEHTTTSIDNDGMYNDLVHCRII